MATSSVRLIHAELEYTTTTLNDTHLLWTSVLYSIIHMRKGTYIDSENSAHKSSDTYPKTFRTGNIHWAVCMHRRSDAAAKVAPWNHLVPHTISKA